MNSSATGTCRQGVLAIEHTPSSLQSHGLRDSHTWPLVSPHSGTIRKSYRVHCSKAWTYPRIELRAANSYPAVGLDLDGASSMRLLSQVLTGDLLCEPNFVVIRKSSGNAHAHWCLAAPVHRSLTARKSPLWYFAKVADYFAHTMLADPGYNGVLTHNPVWTGSGFTTLWLHRSPYTLDELAQFIPEGWKRPRVAMTGIGRNCDTFRWAVSEAHRPRWARRWASGDTLVDRDWYAAVYGYQTSLYGDYALGEKETAQIADQAAKYAARQYSEERFSAIQSARIARRWTGPTIASTKPWERLSISRRTWYRLPLDIRERLVKK